MAGTGGTRNMANKETKVTGIGLPIMEDIIKK
jgi:hypothetical protein